MADRSEEFAVETLTFARLLSFIPSKERDFFNSSYVRGHAVKLDSAGTLAATSACKLQPDLSPSHHHCPKE